MFLPQVEWLKNYEGNIDMDKIIRFENLSEGINEVFEVLSIDNKLLHLNRTPKTTYSNYYDDKSRQIVTDWFHEDIKTFSYTF